MGWSKLGSLLHFFCPTIALANVPSFSLLSIRLVTRYFLESLVRFTRICLILTA